MADHAPRSPSDPPERTTEGGAPAQPIRLYNTRVHEVEPLETLDPGKVRLYVCGISTSGVPHVGHGRSYVVFDTLRRLLEHDGYEVTHVQNFTDIEWAITKRAQKAGVSVEAYAEEMIEAYFETMDDLGVLRAEAYPQVTEYMDEIIRATETLLEHECAYKIPDGVAFRACDVPDWGRLLGRDPASAVVDPVDRSAWGGRETPFDFILWRDDDDMGRRWQAPWGEGRPGWHTECAVMATDQLGDQVDIHGGGADLIFPHHESERAIAECLTGQRFATVWMHNGLVTMDKEKMSKSLSNYVSLQDAIEDQGAATVRTGFLLGHYRDTLEWTGPLVARAGELVNTLARAAEQAALGTPEGHAAQHREEVLAGLREDLDTPRAMRELVELARNHADAPGAGTVLWEGLDLLGLSGLPPFAETDPRGA